MPAVVVLLAPALVPLLSRARRSERVTLQVVPTDTVGHVVQMLGIPLSETGELTADGRAVPRERRRTQPIDGIRELVLEPRERPQPHRGRFLLDVHLAALARRMRLLGIDTALPPDEDDAAIAALAAREDRILLTRDRALLLRAVIPDGALLRHDAVDDQLADVLDRFAPDLAPWTRCLRCGAPLHEVPATEVAALVPAGTRRTYDRYVRCTGCGNVYWRGAHSARLDAIVASAVARASRGPAGSGAPD